MKFEVPQMSEYRLLEVCHHILT